MRLVVRAFGWLCVAAGTLVGLYLVYTLLFTNLLTNRAQDQLRAEWEREIVTEQAEPTEAVVAPSEEPAERAEPEPEAVPVNQPPPPDGAVALLSFARPGSDEPVVSGESFVVIEGVGVTQLRQGPGHYPETAQPGQPGNFAVAGHRVTYGAPFYHLDELVPGDQVIVTDRAGTTFTYEVVEQRIVAPTEISVLDPDPLQRGKPMLTLTTCHPRHSARQRLIVFAELVAETG